MRIPCPYCGDRDVQEFVCRGEAAGPRPALGADPRTVHDYVYLRENPSGPIREHWYHIRGCRNWLVVERDTRTHAVQGATFAQAMRQ